MRQSQIPFVALATAVLLTTGAQAQSNIVYRYDELGRLVQVVDQASQAAATYAYDAVGNTVSISPNSAASVAIISFSPNSGNALTTVRIFGTGFSSAPGQNMVQFNGTQSTVQSASLTEIVTSVPAGATTGPITVTTPSGSASGSKAFVISSPPAISGFTPTVANPGTSVTINGTNFQATAASDNVRFNLTRSPVSSATSGSLATPVPLGATSGPISVATVSGQAVSASDFFVPPDPYKPSDVGFTGRMSVGGTAALTLAKQNMIGLMLFDGKSGQRLSLQLTNSTFKDCGVTLTILSPSGLNIGSFGSECEPILDTPILTADGTYTILAEPSPGAAGKATLTLLDITANAGSTITTDGTPVTINIAVPGEQGELKFNGSAGQRVALALNNGTFPSTCVNVSIMNPDGTLLNSSLQCLGVTAFISAQTLSMTGVYTILVAPTDNSTGTITLNLYSVPPDITGTIAPGGPAVNLSITVPGQGAQLTFNGTAGQQISLVANGTIPGCSVYVLINNPDGTELDEDSTVCFPGATLIGPDTLPATGTYTVLVSVSGIGVGTVTLNLYNVPGLTAPITIGGPGVYVNITVPGQEAGLTLSGSAKQSITVHGTNNTFDCYAVTIGIVNPDGTELYSASVCGASFDLPSQVLPATGTYTVTVQPAQANLGSVTIGVTSP